MERLDGQTRRRVVRRLTEAPADVKRDLFRRHVTLVELEVHAKCNRICRSARVSSWTVKEQREDGIGASGQSLR